MPRILAALTASFAVALFAGCGASTGPVEGSRPEVESGPRTASDHESLSPSPAPTTPRARSAEPASPAKNGGLASDGRPRRARLSIPAIGVRALRVVPYAGSPDDAPGTRIQDGGVAASPHGRDGGVGPGGIGNYLVTAHRTSSTRAFADLPSLRRGDRVHVAAAGTRYTYRIEATRSTSFRSARSLARQSAAVPGHPGRRPTSAMITLSTCATPEDHARGNYWADEFGNPEHRIDKIGVLVAARPRQDAG
ncbi:MAG TPA: sortase [Nocardioidaceae bacterium]|nr:sortase [Nocardioidaceae bacterium]